MQITSSTQTGAAASASPSRPAVETAKPNDSTKAPPPSSAKVTLSDAAKKKHYETKDAAVESADTTSDQPQLSRNKSAIASGETEKPSAVKSLVYGALNLPPPEEAAKNPDKAYSAGKWLGAVGTVIGVATLLLRFI